MMVPCKDCLIVPACKYKTYGDLLRCYKLRADLYTNPDDIVVTRNRKSTFRSDLCVLDKILGTSYRFSLVEDTQE